MVCQLEVKAVAEFGQDDSGVVVVEAADGERGVLQDSVVGDVEDAGRELAILADVMSA